MEGVLVVKGLMRIKAALEGGHLRKTHFIPSVAFHIETSHLICRANQMTGFYIKCNTGLKWANAH